MTRSGPVVVIGGANVDLKSRTLGPAVLRTSNPGRTRSTLGGVARNVAEGLARLGTPTALVTVVGHDADGQRLLADTASAGVDVGHVVRTTAATGTYTAVLDADGELLVGVADMAALDELRPAAIAARRALLARASMLVVDCNLAEATLGAVLRLAGECRVPVVADPVSVPKAERLRRALPSGGSLHTATPNLHELAVLAGRSVADDSTDIAAATRTLHALGVDHVWVRRGARGSLLSGEGGARVESLDALPAAVVDVTGAGDAMLAGYVHALRDGADPWTAARVGHVAAAVTIASEHTVRPDLSPALLAAHVPEPAA